MRKIIITMIVVQAGLMQAQLTKIDRHTTQTLCLAGSKKGFDSFRGNTLTEHKKERSINMGCAILADPGFQAIRNGMNVDLSWTTSAQKGCAEFILQRSPDSLNYETIALVRAAGSNNQITDYKETDYAALNGKYSYRMLTSTFDGETRYSLPVTVSAPAEGPNAMHSAETDKILAAALNLNEKEILLVLRDKKGAEYYSKFMVTVQNNQLQGYDTEKRVDPGNYLVIASSNNKIYGKRIEVK